MQSTWMFLAALATGCESSSDNSDDDTVLGDETLDREAVEPANY